MTYREDRKKAISAIVKKMKESITLKNLTEDQWELIQHYVLIAFIDGKDYAVSKYLLKDTEGESHG